VNNAKSGPFGSVLVDSPPGSLVLVSGEGDIEDGELLSPPAEPIEEADELAPPELAPEPGSRVIVQPSANMTSPTANNPTAINDFLGIHHLLGNSSNATSILSPLVDARGDPGRSEH
jgi:hypothetical protein